MDMENWIRPYIMTEDHEIYRAYATQNRMKLHGAYHAAIKYLLKAENLEYVDGELVEKTETTA